MKYRLIALISMLALVSLVFGLTYELGFPGEICMIYAGLSPGFLFILICLGYIFFQRKD